MTYMKPIIGVTAGTAGSILPKLNSGNPAQQAEHQMLIENSMSMKTMYEFNHSLQMVFDNDLRAIERAGGIPLIIPARESIENLDGILGLIDGLLITGGYDIDPTYYHEDDLYSKGMLGDLKPLSDEDAGLFAKFSKKRDLTELALVKKAYNQGIPIMGICRGTQVINVAMGGNVYQDILLQEASKQNHSVVDKWNEVAHDILIEEDSHLYKALKKTRLGVNSLHHQSLKDIGDNLKVVAAAEDGIVECIEGLDHRFVLGVQWHPEMMAHDDDHQSIVRYFVDQCNRK
jgi:putative glutamine amidotransferase